MSEQQTKIDDGGTAFPIADEYAPCGMSLRDYFAGKAMQSMFQGFNPGDNTAPGIYHVCAREAYTVADAMIEARKPRKDPK